MTTNQDHYDCAASVAHHTQPTQGGLGDALFQAVFQGSADAMALLHPQSQKILATNDAWFCLTGVAADNALGHSPDDLGLWPAQGQDLADMWATLQKGERVSNAELTLVRKDRTACRVCLNAYTALAQGQSVTVMALRDVTADRLTEETLRAGEAVLAQTNEQLRRKIEIFEMVESLAKAGHWMVSHADATNFFWSKGLYALTAEVAGQHVPIAQARSRIHPDDLPAYLATRERMDGETLNYRWLFPDQRYHWIRTQMRRLTNRDGSYTDLGVVQDFTEEQLAKRALQDRFNQIQRLTSRLPEMVFEFCHDDASRGKFLFVSDAVQAIFRISPQAACADPHLVFGRIHPDDQPAVLQSMIGSTDHDKAWAHEFRVAFEDGTVRVLFGKAVSLHEPSGQRITYGSVTDITDHKASQASLRQSEARFRALTELSSDWYWEQDANFRFIWVNGNLPAAMNFPEELYLGKTRWESGVQGVTPAQWAAHRAALEAHETFHDFEMQRVRFDGSLMWVSISGTPIFDTEGRFTGYQGIGRDTSARRLTEEKIERLAFYDVLTELPNRRLLMDRLHQAIATSGRDGSPGALLFIDLDNFKDLNDTLGHDMGDQLLKQVAARLVDCVREVDTVARLGGDEFVVMLEKLGASANEAAAYAEAVGRKVLRTLNAPYWLGGHEHHSTPSIGITLFRDHLLGMDELLKQADLAMYQAKAAGRNTLLFFDPQMQSVVAARASMEADLRHGLQRQELVLYYQPVVDQDGLMLGVEALVRWQHPTRGLVMPGEFIPLAEQTNLILPLGQWVLAQACQQLKVWSAQPRTVRLSVAVNVSARQFRQADFVEQVMSALVHSGADPTRLTLEITESLLLSEIDNVVLKMSQLRTLGVRFSLDDFGTGYSSLMYLKNLPLEQLKIDQSFVRDVLTDPNDAAIAVTVLSLGKTLGLTVVAEGVETEAQRDFLVRHGCRVFQGYLFGRPVPVSQLPLDGPP